MSCPTDDYLRLPTNPGPAKPPVGKRDIRWSPDAEAFVVRSPDGSDVPLAGSPIGVEDLTDIATADLPTLNEPLAAALAAAGGAAAGYIDVTASPYNAVGDGARVDNGVVSGVNVTAAGFNFTGRAGQYVRIVNAGSGGTVDHITTIATAANGSFTLTVTAPTAIASNATIFFGTDNTTEIQNAITAAGASGSLIREVYFPPGVYLGNWTVPVELALRGAGGGMLANFDVPSSSFLQNRQSFPTVLLPAVSTSPVLSYANVFGNSMKNLMVAGSTKRQGRGCQVGDPDPAQSGYTGSDLVCENVNFCGFQYGFIAARTADFVFNCCIFADSTYNCYLGELSSSLGPADSCVFNACIMGGPSGTKSTYNLWSNSCKATVVNAGDWNNANGCIYMEGGGTLTINGLNSEAITNSVIDILAGTVVINNMTILSNGGPVVSALGASVGVFASALSVTGTTSGGLWNSVAVFYRTAGAEYPDRLPRGGAITRYSSTAWSTLNEGELTSRVYELPMNTKRMPRIEDAFVGNYAASPYGALGWVLTAISGTPLAGRASAPGNGFGVLETYFNSNTQSNEFRFGLPSEIQLGTANYWEMRWTLYTEDEANNSLRWGLYCLDGPLDGVPQYGVGFHVNRSTPDATVFAEVINNGVITRMNTTMAYTGLGAMKEYVITRNSAGLFFTIKNPLHQNGTVIVPQLKHTEAVPSADYLVPSLFSAAAAVTYQQVYHDQFSLELIAP